MFTAFSFPRLSGEPSPSFEIYHPYSRVAPARYPHQDLDDSEPRFMLPELSLSDISEYTEVSDDKILWDTDIHTVDLVEIPGDERQTLTVAQVIDERLVRRPSLSEFIADLAQAIVRSCRRVRSAKNAKVDLPLPV